MLIVPDAHRPYHDERAWALVLKAAKAFRPQILVVIGDFADFYAVSAHSKDPRRVRDLEWEVGEVKKGLDDLDALGAQRKVYVEGNHEDRLRRYLQDRAPELFGTVSVPKVLGLKERGWEFIPYRRDGKVGKVHITHDVGNAGRYASYKALDVFQHSVVTGHSHRLSYVVEGNAVGEQLLSAQFGWLGDVNRVDYDHRVKALRNWALGFGIGYLDPATGLAYLTPIPIVRAPRSGEYTCVVEGKLYKG
ncbi:MAG TPA: hypothetical protein VEI97_09265 [bacterium]|nr:hypothetical protein [bacterium]